MWPSRHEIGVLSFAAGDCLGWDPWRNILALLKAPELLLLSFFLSVLDLIRSLENKLVVDLELHI